MRIEEEPPKQPGKGEVRLKVLAVGLNRAELMFMRDQFVEHPTLPGGLGYEAAGLVEAVGPDVDKSWIGKPVSTIPSCAMNDYAMLGEGVIAPGAALGEYPPNLSPVEGAAIWMQYLRRARVTRKLSCSRWVRTMLLPRRKKTSWHASMRLAGHSWKSWPRLLLRAGRSLPCFRCSPHPSRCVPHFLRDYAFVAMR